MSEDLSGFSLMDLFRSEAEQHTANLSSGLLALEQGTGQSSAVIEPMMRAAHSIKGAARIVGLEPAVDVAHVMEDCFVAVQEGKFSLRPKHVDTLLRGVDLLSQISALPENEARVWRQGNEAAVAALVAEIRAIIDSKGAEAAPTPAAGGPPPPSLPAVTSEPHAEPPAPQKSPIEVPANVVASAAPTPPLPAAASIAPAPAIEETSPTPAAQESADRVVRVTAESLSRLMSLAGESLVQSRQLRPFFDSLLALKRNHSDLLSTLQTLRDRRSESGGMDRAAETELLARAEAQANQCTQLLGDKMEQFEDFARRGEDLSGRLHHEVQTSRMRPMSDGVRGFPRLVRDISRKLNKRVLLEIVGENTGVDRDILEKLEAPLNHLIRNGLDHAIETPEEREAAGKPAVGKIRLEARHRAGMLQITLSDDGRGIDPERVRAKVVERGLTTAAIAAQLTESELLEFLFLPGFSTKEKVTEISGRGVGLDVVQNMVREVGGVVRITSQPGLGTRFVLQLPITMSVIRALLVRVAGQPYAFPLNRIDRIVVVPKSSLLVLEARQHFMLDDQPVGLVEACQVFGLEPDDAPGELLPVVVASDRSHRFGVVVDAFLGERDLEVRPLDPRLGKVPNINSASVLEDGWPVLIIDVEDLVRSIDNMLSGRLLRKLSEATAQKAPRTRRKVLVVDDSVTVRELERQLLQGQGYDVDVAIDGVDGWNTVRGGDYDLVISDVDMPRMDGIQLVTLIKQSPELRSTPVIIVSYKDREEDRMRGLDAGANAYLTKSSFHDRTFLRMVVDLIGEAT
jgi:two-component system sensor histidine kinase and response regulator WspE